MKLLFNYCFVKLLPCLLLYVYTYILKKEMAVLNEFSKVKLLMDELFYNEDDF